MNSRFSEIWCSPKTLAALVEVNELCIELLCALAAEPRSAPCISPVEQLRDTFQCMDVPARRRAAQCPLLLVNLEFRNVDWWQRVRTYPRQGQISSAPLGLPRKPAIQLARAALTLAWHTARFEREAASLVMGMSPAVVDILAAQPLREIDRLAQTHGHRVRPRWSDRIVTWRSLLLAAKDADSASIRDFQIYAIQLAGGEALHYCA